MSIVDILTGKLPFWKSTGFLHKVTEVEAEFAALINSTVPHNWQKHPAANPEYVAEAQALDNAGGPRSAGQYTLLQNPPIKIADTQGQRRKIYITVIRTGQTCFVSHDPIRLRNNYGGVREGVPITNAATGQPLAESLDWQGEMYAVGSLDGVRIDVEME